ncbi:hypothetical protein TNCV_2020411 [Trichonephila clavipes]|nr:hypothetical protein TNCV_2020411 [Trichonephila clavipes]
MGEGLLCHFVQAPSRSPRSNTTRKAGLHSTLSKSCKILESVHSEYGGHKFFVPSSTQRELLWHNMYKDTNFVRSCTTYAYLEKNALFKILPPAPHQLVEQVLNQEKRVIWIFSSP